MIAFVLEYLIVGLAVAVGLLGLMMGLAWIFGRAVDRMEEDEEDTAQRGDERDCG